MFIHLVPWTGLFLNNFPILCYPLPTASYIIFLLLDKLFYFLGFKLFTRRNRLPAKKKKTTKSPIFSSLNLMCKSLDVGAPLKIREGKVLRDLVISVICILLLDIFSFLWREQVTNKFLSFTNYPQEFFFHLLFNLYFILILDSLLIR